MEMKKCNDSAVVLNAVAESIATMLDAGGVFPELSRVAIMDLVMDKITPYRKFIDLSMGYEVAFRKFIHLILDDVYTSCTDMISDEVEEMTQDM